MAKCNDRQHPPPSNNRTRIIMPQATEDELVARPVASLTRLEKAWLKQRYCGFCEAPLLGSLCYAHSGEYELPVIEGVRDKPEIVDLGPKCNMDERRVKALGHYRPRASTKEQQP
jgi:hypothetical protein